MRVNKDIMVYVKDILDKEIRDCTNKIGENKRKFKYLEAEQKVLKAKRNTLWSMIRDLKLDKGVK